MAQLGCSSEPAATERVHLELAAATEGARTFGHAIAFADGASIERVRVSPDRPKPGDTVELSFVVNGAAGGPARVGLMPPVEAARQYITDMGAKRAGGTEDPRVEWKQVTLGEGEQSLSFELPAAWNPRSAVFVLERRASPDGPAIEVVRGPRSEAVRTDGYDPGVRAVLASVSVQTAPPSFEIAKRATAPVIDGELSEGEWPGEGFELVESLEGEPVRIDRTRVWFGWDERALYVAAKLDDRDIWSDYEQRDDPLYRQEAFELFIAGGPSVELYLEYQVSARNVVFDAAFQGHRNGDEGFNGMWEHAVKVDGTINQRKDRDRGWTVELAFAWPELCAQTRLECPVGEGTPLRINAFRLDKDAKGRQRGQALAPTRQPDFHHWASAAKVRLGGLP